jgi:hypothetical protein
VLSDVAESAYLKRFTCWWSPTVSRCCMLSGVKVVSIGEQVAFRGGAKRPPKHSFSLAFTPLEC